MAINWFPGHMVAAQKKAAESMGDIDVVVEVLDARCPGASVNPRIQLMREARQKPALKILNKVDLADPTITERWLAYFNAQQGVRAIGLSCKKSGESNKVLPEAKKLAPHRVGPLKPLRVMMMGMPNVGKSTLINALCQKRVANVGDEPAITKLIKRYDLADGTWLFDSPGLMWPKIALASDGLLCAANHLIGVRSYIDEEIAYYLADILLARYPDRLAERYGIDPSGIDSAGVIAAVAMRRGFRSKGGAVDLEKAAVTLLLDYRGGALGRITVETPETREALLAAQVVARTQTAALAAEKAEAQRIAKLNLRVEPPLK